VRVGVLGPLLIDPGAGTVPVAGVRLRCLLVRLALDAGRPLRSELLAQALWGHKSRRCRPALCSHWPAGCAGFSATAPWWPRTLPGTGSRSTRGRRRAPVRTARRPRTPRAGRRRPQQASDELGRALGLWRVTPLADVRTAPFAPAHAIRLERLRPAALEDRIEADLILVRAGLVDGELETLAVANPLRERLRAQLLRAMAATSPRR
jgi:hypothetical protein